MLATECWRSRGAKLTCVGLDAGHWVPQMVEAVKLPIRCCYRNDINPKRGLLFQVR